MPNDTERVPVKREGGKSGGLPESSWAPLVSLRDDIDQLFDDFASGWAFGPFRRQRRGAIQPFRGAAFGLAGSMPALDVMDKEKKIEIHAELPGMDESDIDVRLSDGMLTIRGEKKEEREEGEEEGSYYLSERRYGSFQRSIQIPEGIDRDKIEASFRKGVLTVSLPKTPEAQEKSKKIEVRGEK